MNSIQALANDNKTLTFKEAYVSPNASYVSKRQLDKVIPLTGSSAYTPESTSRITWRLPAGQFVDMNDIFFTFNLKLKEVKLSDGTDAPIKQIDFVGTHALFNRMTITVGGVVVEDINNMDVIEQILHCGTDPFEWMDNASGYYQGLNRTSGAYTTGIKNGMQFMFKPKASGILTNDLLLPAPYLPEVIIELYLNKGQSVFKLDATLTGTQTIASCSYQLSDVAMNVPFVEFDNTFRKGFEESLQKQPLNYQFNTFSNFTQNLTGTADVAVGAFRTDIKSIFAVTRNPGSTVGFDKNNYEFDRNGITSYQVSLGTAKYPLESVKVDDNRLATSFAYLTQAVSNTTKNSPYSSTNIAGKHFIIGLDLSNSKSSLGGVDSTLTFGSPLLFNVQNPATCMLDAFVHYGSILTIMPDRSVVCTF